MKKQLCLCLLGLLLLMASSGYAAEFADIVTFWKTPAIVEVSR